VTCDCVHDVDRIDHGQEASPASTRSLTISSSVQNSAALHAANIQDGVDERLVVQVRIPHILELEADQIAALAKQPAEGARLSERFSCDDPGIRRGSKQST